MGETISKTSSNSTVINRDSISTNLENRYRKSRIQETKAPVAVDFMPNTFVKGFTIKERSTEQTGTESIFHKGFSNQKYAG